MILTFAWCFAFYLAVALVVSICLILLYRDPKFGYLNRTAIATGLLLGFGWPGFILAFVVGD